MRNVLVVVDMQNDFVDGALGSKEAVEIVPRVVNRIHECKENSYDIFVTLDTHNGDYMDTQEGKKLPVPHCIVGTKGIELNAEVKNALQDYKAVQIFNKPTFGSVRLAESLHSYEEEIGSIELIGLCTDICVISNAMLLKAYMPEKEIIVNSSCCAGVSVESHNRALEAMKMCQIGVK